MRINKINYESVKTGDKTETWHWVRARQEIIFLLETINITTLPPHITLSLQWRELHYSQLEVKDKESCKKKYSGHECVILVSAWQNYWYIIICVSPPAPATGNLTTS